MDEGKRRIDTRVPSLLMIHKFIRVQLSDAIVATNDRDPAILKWDMI